MKDKALEILKKYYGYNSFKNKQADIIDAILNKNQTIGIMPTGGGKSICYQIPALIFEGLTIVISPLISLMKDQVDSLRSIGVDTAYINSSLSQNEIKNTMRGISESKYKIIYIAPERLLSDYFINTIKNVEVSFVAVDEAHCISQWGHDFRKSYLEIPSFIEKIEKNPIVGAFTATATPEVRKDIKEKLRLKKPVEFISGFDRENLKFTVIKGENSLKFITKYIEKNSDISGIIYTSTRKEVDSIYEHLSKKGYKTGRYHAGLTEKERKKQQEDFIYDRYNIMVATNAFGMGIDKPNVRYVIHNNIPKDMESYYQEAGRAGRDGENSECILIYSPKDILIQRFFIENNEFEASEEVIQIKYEKLNSIVNYCNTSKCLRSYILEYFGDKMVTEKCGNCGNCLENREKEEITIQAKKIISCIGRTKEMYGINLISGILKGSKNKKILEWNLDKTSTYGIMEEYNLETIKDMINLMVADEYLTMTTGEYPVLKLTQKAYEFLKSDDKIYRNITKIAKIYDTGEEFFEALKILRKEIANDENVPPYVVFSDATLKEMSKYLPSTKEEMLAVKGVGEVKFQRYGSLFIKIIKEYKEKNNPIHQEILLKGNENQEKKPSFEISYELYTGGKSLNQIAKDRNIAETTVIQHILEAAEKGKNIKFYDLFSKEEEKIVKEAVNKIKDGKLKSVKEILPENITYDKIKAVIVKSKIES